MQMPAELGLRSLSFFDQTSLLAVALDWYYILFHLFKLYLQVIRFSVSLNRHKQADNKASCL